MNIAILGAGNVGGALARLWAARGHTVLVGSRNPASPTPELPPSVQTRSIPGAVSASVVVVLSLPWPALLSVVSLAGDLTGKVLIDTSNPLLPDLSGLTLGTSTSAAELIAAAAPGAHVVKAFNTIGALLLGNAEFGEVEADGFLCGDDPGAKQTVAQLVSDAGLHPLDVGPLVMARTLEPLALLWIDLALRQKRPPSFAFKLLHRPEKVSA